MLGRCSLVLVLLPWGALDASEHFERFVHEHCSASSPSLLVGRLRIEDTPRAKIEAALLAAGNDARRIQDIESAYASRVAEFRHKLGGREPLVGEIFDLLHEQFLSGHYIAELFDVGQTVIGGDFNCLTATILFDSLCDEFGLTSCAIGSPAHVRCWVELGAQTGLIVETTVPEWDKAYRRVSGTDDRLLTPNNLVAKVLYNRGVWLLEQKQFANALACTWAACGLDPGDVAAQRNLRASVNNWALNLAEQGNFSQARFLLEVGLLLDPLYGPFQRNLAFVIKHESSNRIADRPADSPE